MAPKKSSKRILSFAVVLLVYLGVVFFVQISSGCFQSELAHYPDEPAHVVTSLMVHDYLRSGMHESPLRYAENYYVHYPKVGLGMWPPVFYVISACWMFVWGTTHSSLLWLIAVQAALLTTTLYYFARRLFPSPVAFLLGLGVLANSLIQYGMTIVLLDISIALFELWAILLLLRLFETRRTRDGVLFGVLVSLAMLTKGNADCLVLVPVFLLVLTWRWDMLRCRGLYWSAGVVLLLGSPWQFVSLGMLRSSVPLEPINVDHVWRYLVYYLHQVLLPTLGAPIVALALVGIGTILHRLWHSPKPVVDPALLRLAAVLSFLVSVLVFHCIAPNPVDFRYMTPVVPVVLVLFAVGVRTIADWLRIGALSLRVAVVVGVVLTLLSTRNFSLPKRPALGFGHLTESILSPQKSEVILVCSDSEGEGALISEVAFRDQRPQRFVLRSSKVLSENDWDAAAYRPLFEVPGALLAYLDSVPVDTVVIDFSKPLWEADRKTLLAALNSSPATWLRSGEIAPSSESRHLVVYTRRTPLASSGRKKIQIRMRFTLGRDLTLQ